MSNQSLPDDHFKRWRDVVLANADLRVRLEERDQQIAELQREAFELRQQLSGMVDRQKAKSVALQAVTLGKVRGHEAIASKLEFPWPAEKTVPISELWTAYQASFDARLAGGKKKPPSPKAREKYQRDIDLFVEVMGDVRIGAIDRELVGRYVQVLKQLPANMHRSAQFKGRSIPEILAMKPEPQSDVTISGKLITLSSMFRWALDEKRKWGIDHNRFAGFALKGKNKTVRRPFTHDELVRLFSHPDFTKRSFRTSYGFWLIPLGLFTGARLGELCQLNLSDFVTVDSVPCIDVNDEQGKRLKTENAKRLVPIHPELIRLGLLRYVEKLRSEGHAHLFPELSRTRRDGPAHAASNWFQKFRAQVGIVGKQEVVFHSFRHGFISNLLDQGIPPHAVAPIVGHERELVTGQIYWNVKDVSKRKPTVDAFALPPSVLALIPPVEEVRLPRAKLNTSPPRC